MDSVADSTAPAPLSDMPERRPLRVAELKGSPSIRSRLYSLGVLPGTPLEICSRSGCDGSLCVRVRCCAVVVDASLARRIYCTLENDFDPVLYGPAASDQADCACCGHFDSRCAGAPPKGPGAASA